MIKAEAICKMTGEIVLADDSGLEIDFLNKEPLVAWKAVVLMSVDRKVLYCLP